MTRIMEHHDGRNISMVNNIRKIWTNTKFYCVAPIFCKLPSHVNSGHSKDMFDSFGTNESEMERAVILHPLTMAMSIATSAIIDC